MYTCIAKRTDFNCLSPASKVALSLLSSALLVACVGPRDKPDDPPPRPEEGGAGKGQVQQDENATQVQFDAAKIPLQKAPIVGDASFKLMSDAVKSRYVLPLSATCDGEAKGQSIELNWKNAPALANSYALGMYHYPNPNDEGDFSKAHVYWSQFDIPAEQTSLAQGQNNVGKFGPNTVDGNYSYTAPCSKDSTNQLYTITLYALSIKPGELEIQAKNADLASLYQAVSPYILGDASLTLQRARYNPKNDEHIPTRVATDCAAKSEDFSDYSDKVNVSCNETQLLVTTKTFLPDRSKLDADRSNVGIKSWIGRVPIPAQATWSLPLIPNYLSDVNSNLNIHDAIGISVEGIPILHYAKENSRGEIAQIGEDYSDRDTALLGEIDQCGAHAGNGEDYHYHMAPLCLMDAHDPSKPLAYMFDGLPLYYGTAGGQLTQDGTDYGAGRYTDLNYLPDSVQRGKESLDECNAYDLKGDGSEYVYYTTKEAPYTIGCYRAQADQSASVPGGEHWSKRRDLAWSGSDVSITDSNDLTFNGENWSYIEVAPGDANRKISAGDKAMILYRQLNEGEKGYESGQSCFSFRYRLDTRDQDGLKDIESTHCR